MKTIKNCHFEVQYADLFWSFWSSTFKTALYPESGKNRIKVNRNKYVPTTIYVCTYTQASTTILTIPLIFPIYFFITLVICRLHRKILREKQKLLFGIRKHPQNVKDFSEALHTSFNDINQTIIVKKNKIYA